MFISIRFSILAVSLTALCTLLPAQPVLALGVSPSIIELSEVLPNDIVEQSFEVARGNPRTDLPVSITVEGEAAKHIDIVDGREQVLAAGVNFNTISFTVNTHGMQPGSYTAGIAVNPTYKEDSAVNAIQSGASLDVAFTVSEEKIEIVSLTDLQVLPDENDPDVLTIAYNAVNEGNIPATAAKVEFIVDVIGTGESAVHIIEGTQTAVAPFSKERIISAALADELATGLYDAYVVWYDSTNRRLGETDRLRFHRGDNLKQERVQPPPSPYKPYAVYGAFVALCAIILSIFIIRRYIKRI